MAHETLTKFGYPANLIRESKHWALLVRPQQVTLGSLVLCALSDGRSYADLPAEAFVEQREMVVLAERLLADFVRFERINYLMLMMVDPHVHFHIIPRYSTERSFGGQSFRDSAWPGPPDMGAAVPADERLVREIRGRVGG